MHSHVAPEDEGYIIEPKSSVKEDFVYGGIEE
jgi:hypothetical protein